MALALWVRQHTWPLLVDPQACGGLLDYAVVLAARLTPDAALGRWLLHVDAVTLVAATVAVTLSAMTVAGSPLAGASIAAAAVFLPAFEPRIGQLPSAAVLAAALGLAGLLRSSLGLTTSGAVVGAAIWPQLWIPLGLAIFASRARRERVRQWHVPVALGGAALVAAVAVAGVWAMAPSPASTPAASVTSCLLPGVSATPLVAEVTGLLFAAGPYLIGLAVLGLATASRQAWWGIGTAFGFVTAVSAGAEGGAPALSAGLVLAGSAGLASLASTARRSFGGRLALTFFVALGPLLAAQAWSSRQQLPHSPAWGHRDLSLTELRPRIDVLPAGVVLVGEDAVTALLIRAGHLNVHLISLAPLGTGAAAATDLDGAYAMPRAQALLTRRGFAATDVEGVAGLARVARVGECRGVSGAWRAVTDLLTADAIALAARSPDEVGPVVAYLSFRARPNVHPVDWPTPRLRGLYWTNYTRAEPASMARLADDRAADGFNADFPAADATDVVRLELWRFSEAPGVMVAGIGAKPIEAHARMTTGARPQRIGLCPAFPHDIRPFFPEP